MRRWLVLASFLVAMTALVPSAHAAFPGRNGVIGFIPFDDGQKVVGLAPEHRLITLIPPSARFGDPDDFQFSPGGRVLVFTYPQENIWIRSVSRRARPRPMLPYPPGQD